jgi:CRISPR-associated protein Csb2
MLVICWDYLGGRAVATDPNDRTRPEWPPHPDRVFQALVAAWAGRCDLERDALAWLCAQDAPQLAFPDESMVSPGAVVKTFVPVNDIEGPARGNYSDKHLGLLPSSRKRSARYFPATNVGNGVCALVWPRSAPGPARRAALDRLCRKVTYLGHSTSLVHMWLSDDAPAITLVPEPRRPQVMLRVPDAARLDALERAHAGGGIGWSRPPQSGWQGYAARFDKSLPRGAFDDRLIVLRQTAGARLGLLQAQALARGLRGALIRAADDAPSAKRLLSGHEPDGRPLAEHHVAYLSLAYVADPASRQRYADGHLLGAALALPAGLDGDLEQEVLDALATTMQAGGGRLRITLGAIGVVALEAEVSAAPAIALRSETWTRASTFWGTVTPIALDRSPPRRHSDHDRWASDQIMQTCQRQGLPEPAEVQLLPASPHLGAPVAAAFGALLRKDGTRRWHLHARLRFQNPVGGPLVLGAGRYLGYGLCKPLLSEAMS